MKLLEFFMNELEVPKGQIILAAVISGLANSALLAVINAAAEQVSNQAIEFHYFLLYITTFLLFIYTQRYALSQATTGVEKLIRQIQLRIIDKVRRSELRFIEETGSAPMYTLLTQDTPLISETAIFIVMGASSIILLVFSGFYLAWLSPISLLISVTFIGAALLMYLSHSQNIADDLQLALEKEAKMFQMFDYIFKGFKELKINRHKNNDLFNHVERISEDTQTLKVRTAMNLVTDMMYFQVAFYLLLSILVFMMPMFSSTHSEVIFKITATTLFLIGPVDQLALALPMLAKVNVTIDNIYQLEAQLDKELEHQSGSSSLPIETFQEIRLDDMNFHYIDQSGNTSFSIGAINLTIKQGEILFIVGGNGSGKSTLLKLLIGLYYPATGSLYVDDEKINQTDYQSYRELFSIIFTDFQLFDRLYGLRDIDEERLNSLLRVMELDNKTQFVEGKFTNTDLSTGQKKRLAFIAAVLEDKPVYIFDEVAADQDPQFRKYFYEVILQDLKKQGKTIIAVTHDDKYFNTADRVLKMEYGQLVYFD